MKKSKLLIECSCNCYHYLQVDEWGKGEVVLALVDKPDGLWQRLKTAWKHKDAYIVDIVLNKEQQAQLIEALTPTDQKAIIKSIKNFNAGKKTPPEKIKKLLTQRSVKPKAESDGE